MGQKVHPESMRVGYIHDWQSNWFNERNFAEFLAEDVKIREHIIRKLAHDRFTRKAVKSVTLNSFRLQFLGNWKHPRDRRQPSVKGGVETRSLRESPKMLLREADD